MSAVDIVYQRRCDAVMQTHWHNRREAVDAVKLLATQSGYNVMQLTRKSGSRCVKFICSSCNQKEDTKDPRMECKYTTVIRKLSGKKRQCPWYVDRKASNMRHNSNCTSKPNITLREARLLTKNTSHRRKVLDVGKTTNAIAADNSIPKVRDIYAIYTRYISDMNST